MVYTPAKKNLCDCEFWLYEYFRSSIFPPISKFLEKLLAKQIRAYFENNKLFYAGQHGFIRGFSCESALHEFLSDIKSNQEKRLIKTLLFIDFRKVFDLVDSKLLLRKLFDNNANFNSLINS